MMEQRRLGVTMVLKCWGLSGLLHELFCTYCNIIICESVSSYISGFVYDLGCFPLKFFLKRGFLPEVFFPWACRPHVLNKMLYFIGYPGYLFLFCILLGRFSVAICCMAHLVSEVLFVCLFCFVGGVTDSVYFLLACCTLPIVAHIIRFLIILEVVV